jgi:hypothetical protein
MSSVTSTKGAEASASAYSSDPTIEPRPRADEGLRPWQFFVLIALACATAVTWMARSQGVTAVVLLTALMAAAALAALATYLTVLPLVSPEEERTPMIGERTRVALEREKALTLRAIKELEFDRAMKKLSDEDFREMGTKLRARATRLMRQLDAGSGYREKIERDLAKRLGGAAGDAASGRATAGVPVTGRPAADAAPRPVVSGPACAACKTVNDPDARFCKECGAKL